MGKAILGAVNKTLRETVSLPGQVKEGGQTVVEDIQKGGEAEILLTKSLRGQLIIPVGEDTRRTDQPHEGYFHIHRTGRILLFQVRDITGREREAGLYRKSNRFFPGHEGLA